MHEVQNQEPTPDLSLKYLVEDLKMPYHAFLVFSMVMALLQGLILQLQLDPEVLEEVEVPNCHALYRAPYHDHLQEPDWVQDYL